MAGNIIEAQVQKALTATDGSVLAAKRLLVKWAKANPQLLLLFVEPHLEAIIGQSVDRLARPGAALPVARPVTAAAAATPAPKVLSTDAINQLIGQLGRSVGEAPVSAGQAPRKASQEATMRALAEAYGKKRREGS